MAENRQRSPSSPEHPPNQPVDSEQGARAATSSRSWPWQGFPTLLLFSLRDRRERLRDDECQDEEVHGSKNDCRVERREESAGEANDEGAFQMSWY